MNTIMLGVGDLGTTNTAGNELKTLALGSCVAVIFLDPKTRTIGMAHVALPESKANPGRAKERPGYFADTGIPVLMKEMAKLGCDETGTGWIVKLVGGANVADPNNTFNIGKRNVLAIKKILWQCRMGAVAEDVGKNYGRSVAVDVDTGRVTVTSPGRGDWQI